MFKAYNSSNGWRLNFWGFSILTNLMTYTADLGSFVLSGHLAFACLLPKLKVYVIESLKYNKYSCNYTFTPVIFYFTVTSNNQS